MNLYITGAERSDAQARTLVDMAGRIGVAWSREEISWVTWGDGSSNGFYDKCLRCAPQLAKSEDQQADYMVRTFVLSAAVGVQHVSYFQLEDKFEGQ